MSVVYLYFCDGPAVYWLTDFVIDWWLLQDGKQLPGPVKFDLPVDLGSLPSPKVSCDLVVVVVVFTQQCSPLTGLSLFLILGQLSCE